MVSPTPTMAGERPFKPSWIDRFNNRVKELPVHTAVFFVLFGFALILIQVLFLWVEGGLQAGELLPVIIYNGLLVPYLLGLVYLLDNQAETALDAMGRILDTTKLELQRYQYMLSNMPARPTLLAGLATTVFAILLEQLWVAPVRYAALEQLPIFSAVFQVVDKSSAFLFGVFFYHTVRQLRLVNAITMDHIRINLFNPGPAQAFSRLTASTAVGLIVGVYGWLLINPDLLADPVIIAFLMVITVLAIAVFVWPLYGIHRRLKAAKDRALQEIDLRFEAIFSKFNTGMHEGDFSSNEKLHGTIASLEIQYNHIKAIPTWPWKPETAQFAFAAIAFPLALAVIQFLVEQALSR